MSSLGERFSCPIWFAIGVFERCLRREEWSCPVAIREDMSLVPVEAACFDCARGAVPGIRRFDDGKSGLPQPPVVSLRWQHADWRELCLGWVHSRFLRDRTPRPTARSFRGGVHLCEAMGRGHTTLFFGAPFIEGGRASRYWGARRRDVSTPTHGCTTHLRNPSIEVRFKRLGRLGRQEKKK